MTPLDPRKTCKDGPRARCSVLLIRLIAGGANLLSTVQITELFRVLKFISFVTTGLGPIVRRWSSLTLCKENTWTKWQRPPRKFCPSALTPGLPIPLSSAVLMFYIHLMPSVDLLGSMFPTIYIFQFILYPPLNPI